MCSPGLGGSGGGTSQPNDAPNLPGDGLEPTPDEDISDREVPQLPSDRYIDSVIDVTEDVNDSGGSRTRDASVPDAAGPDAAGPDAGPDGST